MDRYFPADKIVLTGNPVRNSLLDIEGKREEGQTYFKLDPGRQVILVTGGSLGARTLNQSVLNNLDRIREKPVQVVWQCGKNYFEGAAQILEHSSCSNVFIYPFLDRMDLAFAAADIIVSRAGAGTISELCVVGKPVILIPSPNVAEDHQTKNARSLVNRKAAILVSDAEASEHLFEHVFRVLENKELSSQLSNNIKALAIPDASERIVNELFQLIKN